MEIRELMDKLATTIFYISDGLLVISLFCSLILGFNIRESFIIIVIYSILISFLYLLLSSINVKIIEEENENKQNNEKENGNGRHN